MGIIPAAGAGSRTQPLAFAKELLPLGARVEAQVARPRAVSEYLIERLILGGADRLCFVVGPDRSDLMSYYGGRVAGLPVCYVVQPKPVGLCDALFCASAFLGAREDAVVGLPDTIWFPMHALRDLPDDVLSFVLFPVARPELFDAVLLDARGEVRAMEVKSARPATSWIWGGFRAPAQTLRELERLWNSRDRIDTALGTLVNAYVVAGGRAVGVRSGRAYVDVGKPDGYREAVHLLHAEADVENAIPDRPLVEGTA
jgi:glucose-1-phosphate thymidylyltransferase